MKNKEFWKGAVAGALVVTCIGTGAFAGTGIMPNRFERLRQEGLTIDSEMFTQYTRVERAGSQLN